MIFDVIVKAGKNTVGKDIMNMYRVHDRELSNYLRNVQDVGHYIVSVIPLFRPKMKNVVMKHILLQDKSAFNKNIIQ